MLTRRAPAGHARYWDFGAFEFADFYGYLYDSLDVAYSVLVESTRLLQRM